MHFAVLTTTIIYATYAGGVLFALIVVRALVRRHRQAARAAGRVSIALLSAVVFLFADSVPLLLVGRVLSGFSAGVFTGTATAAVIEAAPPQLANRAAAVATDRQCRRVSAVARCWRAARRVRTAATAADLHRAHRAGGAGRSGRVVVPETSPRTGRHPRSTAFGARRSPRRVRHRGHRRLRRLRGDRAVHVGGAGIPVQCRRHRQPRGGRRRRVDDLRSHRQWPNCSPAAFRPQRAVVLGCAILVVGMVDSRCGTELSSLLGADRGRGRRRHRTRHQLQPRSGRGRRTARRPTGAPKSARLTSSSPTSRSRCR